MRALSELWGMDEESLDAFIRERDRHLDAPSANGTHFVAAMLGDRMLAGVCETASRTVTINAPAEQVRPWLAQLMRGAGIYGCEGLETPTCRSAMHILTGLPEPRLGDQVGNSLILAAVEPGEERHEIVWASTEPFRLLGHDVFGLTLNYLLEPIDDNNCQLTARLRFASRGMTEQVAALLRNILDALLTGSQITRLRDCIESDPPTAKKATTRSPHQRAPFRPALQAWRPPKERKLA